MRTRDRQKIPFPLLAESWMCSILHSLTFFAGKISNFNNARLKFNHFVNLHINHHEILVIENIWRVHDLESYLVDKDDGENDVKQRAI